MPLTKTTETAYWGNRRPLCPHCDTIITLAMCHEKNGSGPFFCAFFALFLRSTTVSTRLATLANAACQKWRHMSWHPTKNQSVTAWCIKCKKYTTRSRVDGKCPFCRESKTGNGRRQHPVIGQ